MLAQTTLPIIEAKVAKLRAVAHGTKQQQEDERPIQTRLTRLPLPEEDAADLVAFLLDVARKQRAAREKQTDSTDDAA